MDYSAQKPHVLYVTSNLTYPPLGGPSLRACHTVGALSCQTRLSLYLLATSERIGGDQAVDHLLTLCENVVVARTSTEQSAASSPNTGTRQFRQTLKRNRPIPAFLWKALAAWSRPFRAWLWWVTA